MRPFLLALALALSAGSASATTFSFDCVTGNGNGAGCDTGEDQFSLEVLPGGAGEVSFRFRNDSGDPISASELYWDDGTGVLASLVSVTDGSGVDFEEGGSPGDLPNGNQEGFEADFVASAGSPPSEDGVDPGEEVTVIFSLAAGNALADVIAALEEADLRVGVKTVAPGKSFMTTPQGVPEPGALVLLALVALGAGALALRRRRS